MSKVTTEMTMQKLRTEVRILKTEKALNDVLNDLDRMITDDESDMKVITLDDLRDLRADLHGAMSHLRES